MKISSKCMICLILAFILSLSAQAVGDTPRNISAWAIDEISKSERVGILYPIVAGNLLKELGTDYSADITREQFVGLMTGLIESSKDLVWDPLWSGEMSFDDTKSSAVERAYQIGIVKGTGDRVFSPQLPISREQAATMLYRAVSFIDSVATPTPAELSTFQDAEQVSNWAYDAVSGLVGSGIFQGFSDNRLAPKENVSIEQAISLTYRAFGQAIKPQASRLAEEYVTEQKAIGAQAAYSDARVDSLRMVDAYQKGRATFILYSLEYSLKPNNQSTVNASGGRLVDGWFIPAHPTTLVLQLGAGGKFICQGGFSTSEAIAINDKQFSAALEQFLAGGTAQPYDYPTTDKKTTTIGAYDGKTFQLTPKSDLTIEEIIRQLSTQVLDSIAKRDDTTYKVIDYHATTIYDVQYIVDDGAPYWTAWPAFEMKYTGWYGLIGPSDGAWYISDFGTDGGMSRVRIDEKNGTYTLRCWAP